MVVMKQKGINGQKEYFAIDCNITDLPVYYAPLMDSGLEPLEERRISLRLEVSSGYGASAKEAVRQCEHNKNNR